MKEKARVTIYTKPGCHLCDEAKRQIVAAACEDLYELEEVNIETDAELFERYKHSIPVIAINGTEAFKYHLTPAAFKKALKT
ncbi:MAG: glutaredoxin family protein [Acidobacteria bacterium]|nr:glutaredoxin family protein [Acidobacteriota bacterium]